MLVEGHDAGRRKGEIAAGHQVDTVPVQNQRGGDPRDQPQDEGPALRRVPDSRTDNEGVAGLGCVQGLPQHGFMVDAVPL